MSGDDTNYDDIEQDILKNTPGGHGYTKTSGPICWNDANGNRQCVFSPGSPDPSKTGFPVCLTNPDGTVYCEFTPSETDSLVNDQKALLVNGEEWEEFDADGFPLNAYDLDARKGGRGGGRMMKKRELVGRNGGGRQLIFPGTGKASLYKGNRWFPRLYGNQWWLGRHQWFRPYYERYAPLWYPAYWTPLYVYDERNAYVRNPELSTMSVVPSMALPCFEADLGVLRYDRQSLSRDEEARVDSTLNGINQQLELFKLEMQFNPSYVYWTKRGFVVVPDLDRGCFVWAYTRRQQQQQGGMMGMSASSSSLDLDAKKGKETHKHSHHQHEHAGVDLQKEVATLANEKILFDVYSEKTPYTGHFISQDGDVYAYTIDSQDGSKTTFVDRLFDVSVPLNEIERLKDMLRAAAKAKVDHFRHNSGNRKYWGFLGNERMFIRGDDNSHSAEADALVNEIDRILFKKKSLYPAAH